MEKLEDTGERLIPEIHPGELDSGAHLVRYRSVLELVAGRRVLDIACGTGYGTQLMATTAKHVHGVDYSADSIAYAKGHYAATNAAYLEGDALAIPLKDHSVDVVVSFETIEHIPDYQGYLKEIKRVLVPGGTVVVSTPNRPESPRGNHYHLKEFTRPELERLLRRSFDHVEMYFQGVWFATGVFGLAKYEGQWQDPLEVVKSVNQSEEKVAYLFAVCSDGELAAPAPALTLASPWSARRQQYHEEVQQELIDDLRVQVTAAKRDLGLDRQELHDRYEEMRREHHRVVTSKGWRAYVWFKGLSKRLGKN